MSECCPPVVSDVWSECGVVPGPAAGHHPHQLPGAADTAPPEPLPGTLLIIPQVTRHL